MIHSFILIEHVKNNHIFDIVKNVSGESPNKLITSKLKTHNNKILTNNMIKPK